MALEAAKTYLEDQVIIGLRRKNGKVEYSVSRESLEALKYLQEETEGGKRGIVFVGKVKFKETEKGLVLTVEEVDMSKVKYERFKLTEEGEKDLEQRRKLLRTC